MCLKNHRIYEYSTLLGKLSTWPIITYANRSPYKFSSPGKLSGIIEEFDVDSSNVLFRMSYKLKQRFSIRGWNLYYKMLKNQIHIFTDVVSSQATSISQRPCSVFRHRKIGQVTYICIVSRSWDIIG